MQKVGIPGTRGRSLIVIMASISQNAAETSLTESVAFVLRKLLGPKCELSSCDASPRYTLPQPLVETLDDEYRIVFPVELQSTERLLVAGTIPAQAGDLAHKLAVAAQEAVKYLVKTETQQLDVEAYAQQVTLDFEELSWLRTLADYLDCCDLSRDMPGVARGVFPSLRKIISADAIVLVGAQERAEASTDPVPEVGEVLVFDGSEKFSNADCCRIVERLRHAAHSRPAVLNRVQELPEFGAFAGMESCVVVPLAHKSYCAGWLLAVNRLPRAKEFDQRNADRWCAFSECEFGTTEAGLMSSAAVMLATHARNFALLREKETMLIGVIRSLINALDAKDSYTCGHSDRVALIARRIAEELSLEPQECERMYMTGLLHDVGKIGVPDEVLLKPGKLTEKEFAQIKRHPAIGHTIMKHVEQINYVLPGVLHHHEAVNGQGYPDGLVGEQIPLAARILAVADAYDAMTSSRPYRQAMPSEKAESILREGVGKQWDHSVIAAFFRARDDIRQIGVTSQAHTKEILGACEQAPPEDEKAETDSIAKAVSGNHR